MFKRAQGVETKFPKITKLYGIKALRNGTDRFTTVDGGEILIELLIDTVRDKLNVSIPVKEQTAFRVRTSKRSVTTHNHVTIPWTRVQRIVGGTQTICVGDRITPNVGRFPDIRPSYLTHKK